jgi:alanine transaminase
MEYAVRGPIVIRAGEIEKELKQSNSTRPFDRVIRANIGDCHATGQKPLTFLRQVLACAAENSLLDDPKFPADVRQRVRDLLAACGGQSVGAYSDSAGVELVRRHVAEYIQQRDNYPANWQDVVLTGGASEGVRAVLSLVNAQNKGQKPIGVMIPIPQYPLYSATIAEYGMHQINYFLS